MGQSQPNDLRFAMGQHHQAVRGALGAPTGRIDRAGVPDDDVVVEGVFEVFRFTRQFGMTLGSWFHCR